MPALFPLLYDKPFFNFFSHESVSKCARAASVLHVQAHENIVCMGDKVGAVLIVLFGCLSLSYTQVDGRECLVRHLLPGQAVGELALLCGDVSTVSATAVVPSVVVKVAGPTVSALLRNEAGKAVECLLFHLAIQYHSTHLDRLDQKDLVWGSKQWDGVRRAENLAVQERAAQMCHLHVFSHDETGTVKTAIERLAARMNDAGNPVYAATAEAAGVSREFTIEFVAPGSADRMMADSEGPALVSIVAPPRLKVTMELHCSDKVTPYMLAFREMRENVEADPYALSMLKRYAAVTSEHTVRSTPHGFIFDVEGDTLRQDAELARVDAYLSDLHKHKRVNRGLPVWEKMPLMFFVDGIFDREWDRAAERRGEYSSGNFREMASLVESIKSDDRVAELKARTPHRNQRLWRHVEKWREWHYVRQSVPEEGAAFQFFKEGPPRKTAALHIHPLHNWKTLTGLMLVKPQALLDKEKQTLVLSFQDKQLASVQALQQHAGLKTQVKAHKVELSRILAAMQTERGEIKKKFQVLKDGWNGEAVAAIKRARKQIDVLEQDFESVSQTKDRLKALYKLRGNSSDALKWKGSLALDAVWLALSRHTDAREDDVAAYSNAHGGAVEFDLINSINVPDITHPLDLLETPHILKWVQSDKELSKRPAHVRAISTALEKQQINGRMLMHLEKVDLMRMGLQGPVARLLLVRIESFKKDHSLGTFNAAIEKQHALSAELAMIQTPTEEHAFLKAQFNLEDRQVPDHTHSLCPVTAHASQLSLSLSLFLSLSFSLYLTPAPHYPRQVLVYSNTFQKFDFLKRSEIAMVDITAAVASATGNKLHPQILKTLQKKFDPDNSGTIDLVCFCQINKSALVAGGTS